MSSGEETPPEPFRDAVGGSMESPENAGSTGAMLAIDESFASPRVPEFKVEYEPRVRRLTRYLAILIPVALALLCVDWTSHSRWDVPEVVGVCMGLIMSGGCIHAALVNRLHRIDLTGDGISFPKEWKSDLLGRTQRHWSDLHSIQLEFSAGATTEVICWNRPASWSLRDYFRTSPRLLLDFTSGGKAEVPLGDLTAKQAELLLQGLEIWADPAAFAADVVRLEKSLVLEESVSFTELWQEDLNTKYIATTYNPLATNSTVQSGKYRVLMQLSSGGMSSVYLCSDSEGKKVVLKEAALPVQSNDALREKVKELFDREARLLLNLNHKQIARILDYFSESGRDYLVLEHVAGQTIRQIVRKRGKVKEAQALLWARELCSIVEYLHCQQPPILHRDLSPDNIIVREDGRLVLMDFGAANEYIGNATGTFIGNQCYVAPEQFRGRATTRSDIYSLGATGFFMLTGFDPTPLCSSIPAESSDACSKLIARCTHFEQSERPESVAMLSELLTEALSHGSLSRKN
ncbi:MAG: serine/threonine protein kinase [Candidatus Obscuribacterales bacterium]|nr:serine/threonine protein kinase [Candidatus Obscuribacterales bacterium]